jgi:hypothetical protein
MGNNVKSKKQNNMKISCDFDILRFMSIKCRFYFNPSHKVIDFLALVCFRRNVNRNDGRGRKSKLVVKDIIKQGQHKWRSKIGNG